MTTKLTVKITDFRSVSKNTLVGFAPVHAKGASRWIQLPAKAMIDRDGVLVRDPATSKIKYAKNLEFRDAGTKNAFQQRV